MASAAAPLVPPAAPREVKDPSWWRHGTIPFIVLILAAAGLDFAWPYSSATAGIGAGVGCALWCLAILLLRRDFSKAESCFLGALVLISFAALTVSGSFLNWGMAFALPFLLVLFPGEQPAPPAHVRYRSWWGYWLARRKSGELGRWAWLRQVLPTLITMFVGVALFIVFLIIFASGNPVVQLIWNTICEWWNAFAEWLELDWSFAGHVFYWFLGATLFGIYTFARPAAELPRPAAPQEEKGGRSLLPHLPLASLIGINLAFIIATGTDIAYLWFGRVPEGVSQTVYLHDGAASIIWAAGLASAILVFLFRRKGSARQGVVTRAAGYLLAFQTFLLAVSVYMRLFHQIGGYGFTPRRIQAAESLLLGLDGLIILVCYMACRGTFLRYARICLGSMLLMLISFGICPPAELAGSLNLRFAPSHPHWAFQTSDFKPTCFLLQDNLAFGLYVYENMPESVQEEEKAQFFSRLQAVAEHIEWRAGQEGWRHWTLRMARDIPAAEKILGRPICPKEAEPTH